MPHERKYLLYRTYGNRVPVMRHIPKHSSTMQIIDMLPSDMTGKYAIVYGTSWENAWKRNVSDVKTICIDVGTVWED